MAITGKLKDNLEFLSVKVKPQVESIRLDVLNKLQPKEKRSCFYNFVRWFIHIITFTAVSRNGKLDKVTLDILKSVNAIKEFSKEELTLVNNAFKNLALINENNGGKNSKLVLDTAKKINEVTNKTINRKQDEIKKPVNLNQNPAITSNPSGQNKPIPSTEKPAGQGEPKNPTENIKRLDAGQNKPRKPVRRLREGKNPSVKLTQKPEVVAQEKADAKKDEEKIPPEIKAILELKEVTLEKLIQHAEFLFDYKDVENREKALKVIVHKIQSIPTNFIASDVVTYKNTFTKLFPRFEEKIKTTILSRALWEVFEQNNEFKDLFKIAGDEPREIWEASLKKLTQLERKNGIDFEKFFKNELFHLNPQNLKVLLANQLENNEGKFFLDFFNASLPLFENAKEQNHIWLKLIQVLDLFEDSETLRAIIIKVVDTLLQDPKTKKHLGSLTPKLLKLLTPAFKKDDAFVNLLILVKTKNFDNHSQVRNIFKNKRFQEDGKGMDLFIECFQETKDVEYLDYLCSWYQNFLKVKDITKQNPEIVDAKILLQKLNWKETEEIYLRNFLVHVDQDFHPFFDNLFGHLNTHKSTYHLVYKFVMSRVGILEKDTWQEYFKYIFFLDSTDIVLNILSGVGFQGEGMLCKWSKLHPEDVIPYHLILPFITNSNNLWKLFTPILELKDVRYYELIFNHLEKEPWKAYLTGSLYEQSVLEWLEKQKDENGHYRFQECIKLLTADKKKRRQSCAIESQPLNSFFATKEFDKQCEMFNQLTPSSAPVPTKYTSAALKMRAQLSDKLSVDVKPYLLNNTQKSSSETLINDLLTIPIAQLSIALIDEKSRENIIKALSLKQHPLYKKAHHRVIQHINSCINTTRNNETKKILEEFLESIHKIPFTTIS